MWIDLVGDYAGRELFLVEGDSLLRICFEDERLDFDSKFPLVLSPKSLWNTIYMKAFFSSLSAGSNPYNGINV